MRLHERVLKLEKQAIKSFKPFVVIFLQPDEPDEKVISEAKSANPDGKSTLIVVKFVK